MSNETQLDFFENYDSDENIVYLKEVNVTGGRDHRLLRVLAKHMNFEFVYVEAPGRTQGTLRPDASDNETYTGGIGLLQQGVRFSF